MTRCRHVTAALVFGALLGLVGQADAQRRSPAERYDDLKKSPLLAATVELIVPIVGHDYAGDRNAALVSASIAVVGLSLSFGGFFYRCHKLIDLEPDPGCQSKAAFVAKVGNFVYLGSRIWGSVTAWRLANRTNALYRRRLGLDDADLALSVTRAGQFGLGVSLRF